MEQSLEGKRERYCETVNGLQRDNYNLHGLKKTLRKEVLWRRDALSEQEQEKACSLITERLLGHVWYQEAEDVLGFVGYGSEIRTDAILQETLRSGKKLYLPKIVGDEMCFFRVKDLDALHTGYKGIREPQDESEQFVDEQNKRVFVLMPGVAFDMECGRMGYGKGFYDRFLADHPWIVPRTIGIGHACQLVEKVPCEETDIRPAQVLCV